MITYNLSEDNIISILEIHDKSYTQIINNKVLNNDIILIEEKLKKNNNITIKEQRLTNKNKEICDLILNSINDYSEFHDFKFIECNILGKIVGSKKDLIQFKLVYINKLYEILLSQYNFELYMYIRYNNNTIVKDIIFSAEDFKRAFYFIKKQRSN